MSALLVVDIGGTHIKIAAADGAGHRTLGRHIPTASLRSGDPLDGLARRIDTVCREMALVPDRIVTTVPGFLDPDLDPVHSRATFPSSTAAVLPAR